MNAVITSFAAIRPGSCFVNGTEVCSFDTETGVSWFRQIYKFLQPDYPKFYKMDQLSQAAFLSVELLKQYGNRSIEVQQEDALAMVFANSESSSVTDLLFQDSYQHQGSPSPSLFVYTLPNIMLGELSIRNKWYGENMFAVFPKFALDFYSKNAVLLLNETISMVLCGWINVSPEKQEILVFTIEKETSGINWTEEQLKTWL